MLTAEEARKIGLNACIDKIGREFVRMHRDHGVSAYGDGEIENTIDCYVGVSDAPSPSMPEGTLVLDSTSHFPYYANCTVRLADGAIEFSECVVPA